MAVGRPQAASGDRAGGGELSDSGTGRLLRRSRGVTGGGGLRPSLELVDVHCHCLPGLDDGPADLAGALAICRALVEDGVATVVATPHQGGRWGLKNTGAVVREAVAELVEALGREGIPLRVRAGGEVRIDERLTAWLDRDEVMTLADGGEFLLLELPERVWVDPEPLLRELLLRGVTPILAHLERCQRVTRDPEVAVAWVDAGAAVQVNAGSLTGDDGPEAERAGWALLEAGLVSIVAGDAHDVKHRPPRLSAAMAGIGRRLGRKVARQVCVENPTRVLGVSPEGRDRRAPALSIPSSSGTGAKA